MVCNITLHRVFKETGEYYIERVHDPLCDDLYAALPELRPLVAEKDTSTSRKKRGIGAAVLSVLGHFLA